MKLSGLTVAMSLLLIAPATALAEGVVTTFVKDTLQVTGNAAQGAGDMLSGSVRVGSNAIAGTVDALGNVVDGTGRIVGRVIAPGSSSSTSVVTTSGDTLLLGNTNDVYGYSLDTRLGDLRKAINTAENGSRITNSQAADLRIDLDRIAKDEIDAQRDQVMTFDEALSIARDLDGVNGKLATMTNSQTFGQLVVLDGSGVARIFVTSPRVANASSNSTVTSTRTVTDDNGTYTRKTTVISGNGGAISNSGLYSVLDNRRYELDRRIGDAMLRQAIDAQKAAQLQASLDQVRNELMLVPGGSSLTDVQALKIAGELDTLDGSVATSLKIAALSPLTVVDTGSGAARIVADQFGNVIGVREAGPDIYIKTIDTRRLDLEKMLVSGLTSGAITADRAAELRAELDYVARTQSQGAGDFTYINALPLAVSLDYVGNELRAIVPTITYVPLIDGTRFIIIGERVIMLDDIMVRRAELESKIARKLIHGKITASQASNLRAELGSIAVVEQQMRAKGSLTFRDSRELYNRFDKVGSRLDGYHA
jgi:hypothetical protein